MKRQIHCFHFASGFSFRFKYFPFHFASNFSFLIYFTLNFGFCFVPGAFVVYDVLVVFDVAVDCRPSVFDVLKSLESLLFCAANLWKMTCSYCSTSYIFYTDINCNRSIDLTKDGYPFMLVQIKSNHIVLYSSAQWNSGYSGLEYISGRACIATARGELR